MDRYGSMALFFVIALVITAPLAVRKLRRSFAERNEAVAAARAALAAAEGGGPGDDPASGADAEDEPDPRDLTAVIASIGDVAAELRARDDVGAEAVVTAPRTAVLRGREAPEAVAAALVADAVRRSGLEVVRERVEGAERHLTCRLAAPAVD